MKKEDLKEIMERFTRHAQKKAINSIIWDKELSSSEKEELLKDLAEDLGGYDFLREQQLVYLGEEMGMHIKGPGGEYASLVFSFIYMYQSLPITIASLEPEERLGVIKTLELLAREAKKRSFVDKEFLKYAKKCGVFSDD